MAATLDHLEALTHSLAGSVLHGGYVDSVSAGFYRVRGLEPHVTLNDAVWAESGGQRHWGKVIRIDPDAVVVAPYRSTRALRRGDVVLAAGAVHAPRPNMAWLGRVIDALGEPVDGEGRSRSCPSAAALRGRCRRFIARVSMPRSAPA